MKKATFGILALLLIGLVAAGAVSAMGMGHWGDNKEAVRDAIEAEDFDAWKEAMIAGLTEERFDELVERHENMPEDMQERMEERHAHQEAMQAAIESGDFDSWKAIMEESPREEPFELTEENFELFVELHNARQDGDVDKIARLSEELGMPANGEGKGPGGMRGEGMRGGFGEGRGMRGGCGEGGPESAEEQ